VVITASISLADIPGTLRLFHLRRTEFYLSIAAFAGVVALGVLLGILVAVALSIGNVFRRAWWPYQAILGRVPGIAGYHDIRSYPHAELLAGCRIFRFDAPIFFANARTFREQVNLIARSEPHPQWIIIAAEPITDVDVTAADVLRDLDASIGARGTTLVFAEMKDPVRRKLERYALIPTINPCRFFPTLDTAIEAFRNGTGAEWAPPRPVP
jgi:MFS superfamily sulfate permease-like transporter